MAVVGSADVTIVDVLPAAADDVPPVDKLTCLFSSRAKAASISTAGTAVADIMAKSRKCDNDHLEYILCVNREIVYVDENRLARVLLKSVGKVDQVLSSKNGSNGRWIINERQSNQC